MERRPSVTRALGPESGNELTKAPQVLSQIALRHRTPRQIISYDSLLLREPEVRKTLVLARQEARAFSEHADDFSAPFNTKNLPERGSLTGLSNKSSASSASFRTAPLAVDSSASFQSGVLPYHPSLASDATSPGTYFTAPNSRYSPLDPARRGSGFGLGAGRQRAVNVMPQVGEAPHASNDYLGEETEFRRLLASKNLITSADQELNWSGRGQHVEFVEGDEVPLRNLGIIGTSIMARVDKVRCRRIVLARKMMRCNSKWPLSRAIDEVSHLHRLRHPHIVQLVGSYLVGRKFAILIYPVAECHLGHFMEETEASLARHTASLAGSLPRSAVTYGSIRIRYDSLAASLSCLAHALQYIHTNTTKHMDIKPANILVKCVPLSIRAPEDLEYRVYIADFGLSRSFATQGHSQTEGPTSRTPKYCAPEVYDFDRRGRSADIFSLGCVYLEILTVLLGIGLEDLADYLCDDNFDESYHSHPEEVEGWVEKMKLKEWPMLDVTPSGGSSKTDMLSFVHTMLDLNPEKRPTGETLVKYFENWAQERLPAVFRSRSCCLRPPEPYVIE